MSDQISQTSTPEGSSGTNAGVDVGAGFQAGLDVLGKALAGIVQAAKDAIGPELLRNLAAGQLFQQIATCLDEAAKAIEQSGTCPPQNRGQLMCYLERLEAEIKGSKFEAQGVALQGRLEKTVGLLSDSNAPSAAKQIAEIAGYFHAAASSAAPVSAGGPVTFEYQK